MSEITEGNVTMLTRSFETKVYLVAMTLLSTAIVYLAWGYDAPLGNFALVFGGMLFGHTITEMFNEGEEE
jgi:hypothetical protein